MGEDVSACIHEGIKENVHMVKLLILTVHRLLRKAGCQVEGGSGSPTGKDENRGRRMGRGGSESWLGY